MMSRPGLIIMFVVCVLICGYDIFWALRGSVFSWFLAALIGFVAILCLRKLIRQDYSGSWW